jgi:hypothetical protein
VCIRAIRAQKEDTSASDGRRHTPMPDLPSDRPEQKDRRIATDQPVELGRRRARPPRQQALHPASRLEVAPASRRKQVVDVAHDADERRHRARHANRSSCNCTSCTSPPDRRACPSASRAPEPRAGSTSRKTSDLLSRMGGRRPPAWPRPVRRSWRKTIARMGRHSGSGTRNRPAAHRPADAPGGRPRRRLRYGVFTHYHASLRQPPGVAIGWQRPPCRPRSTQILDQCRGPRRSDIVTRHVPVAAVTPVP